jgi:hypothetical protein
MAAKLNALVAMTGSSLLSAILKQPMFLNAATAPLELH